MRMRLPRTGLAGAIRGDAAFVFSRYTRCIDCGGYRVRAARPRPNRPHVRRPLSLLFGVTLAPIYHCSPCRLQYHDWRGIA